MLVTSWNQTPTIRTTWVLMPTTTNDPLLQVFHTAYSNLSGKSIKRLFQPLFPTSDCMPQTSIQAPTCPSIVSTTTESSMPQGLASIVV